MISTGQDKRRFLKACTSCVVLFLALSLVGCPPPKPKQFDTPPGEIPPSATPVVVTGSVGAAYYYNISKISICAPFGFNESEALINWGDGQEKGLLDPYHPDMLVGYHNYKNPGVYQINFHAQAKCENNNTPVWYRSVDGTSTAFIYDQPPIVKGQPGGLVVAPAAINVGQTSIGTLTLSNRAPAGGALVRLMSYPANLVTTPLTVVIPAGQLTRRFNIVGKASGNVGIYATSGEGTTSIVQGLKVN